MDVCGIDPGLSITGYAILRQTRGKPQILDAGVFRTVPKSRLADRLIQLADDLHDLLHQAKPDIVGFEQLYAHYKHPRTAVQMAHARGVLLAEARRAGADVRSFSATAVKRYLTGNGRASKAQMQKAVQSTFGLPTCPEPPDVADAIAIAFCCIADTVTPAAGVRS